ncbi:MAG: 5-bromo-4-chloroindolyl phosphate hydrolysis family protein [Oscillospiraceae bacterium]|nr:5-bromo-4-chloroindolyl phosphate hydrolysis family protein [Oscillospiraceae bacterium]
MDAKQRTRYRQEAQRAAHTAKEAAESFFQQADTSAKAAAQDVSQRAASAVHAAGKASQPKQAPRAAASRQAKPQPDAWNVRDPVENKRRKAKKEGGGTGLIIAGSILTGIFGLGALTIFTAFLEELSWGSWGVWPMLVPIVACLMFAAGGLSMLFSGIGKNRRSERYLNYLAYIGANREVDLAPMAASFGVPVNKLCKDLRRMLAKGILPTGYLDLAEGKLFLTEMGYHAQVRREEPAEETPQQAAAREDDILREIRQVNDEIPDEVMSAKIDRIEEITGKILAYQKSHPNKEGQLRTFLNYYLPTTLKILRAYAQLDAQGIEGENISAAKKRIEDMMDQVVSGFEKQLDKLFQDDAMDITSDVEVLENMLKKDGLSDEGGITMTL